MMSKPKCLICWVPISFRMYYLLGTYLKFQYSIYRRVLKSSLLLERIFIMRYATSVLHMGVMVGNGASDKDSLLLFRAVLNHLDKVT